MANLYTCHICKVDVEEDDTVWADRKGNIKIHQFAYCAGCLPTQEEEGNE